MKAIWNGTVLAQSNETIEIEGNQYFPQTSVNMEYFEPSELTSICPWKGTALYYTINTSGEKNIDASWYYPDPKPAAKEIKNYLSFWKGVEIIND